MADRVALTSVSSPRPIHNAGEEDRRRLESAQRRTHRCVARQQPSVSAFMEFAANWENVLPPFTGGQVGFHSSACFEPEMIYLALGVA